jgi:hypothetical protein
VESLEALNVVLPKQISGHFIHGPKTVLHIVNTYDIELVNDILHEELKKLCYGDELCNSDVKTIYDNLDESMLVLLSDELERYASTADIVESVETFSAEWPAVIVLHQIRKNNLLDNLVTLYLQVSRARVYCVIILFPESGETFDKNNIFSCLLEKSKGLVQIISH